MLECFCGIYKTLGSGGMERKKGKGEREKEVPGLFLPCDRSEGLRCSGIRVMLSRA